jgi:FkbM family methyltransferase
MLDTRTKISIARALSRMLCAARSQVGRDSEDVDVVRGGLRWRLNLREGIDLAIYLLGAFERSTVRAYSRIVKPGDTVLDIGANIGAHTLRLAELVGSRGRVVAYEPTAYAAARLRRNLHLNPELVQRVTVAQVMLTDSDDQIPEREVYSSWPLGGSDDVHALHRGLLKSTEGACAISLDSHVANLHLKTIGFVKMDVDGFECHVLGGARCTLECHRPVILMELAPYLYRERGRSWEELLSLLSAAGYSLFSLDGRRELPMDPRRLGAMIPSNCSINVIAKASSGPRTSSFP